MSSASIAAVKSMVKQDAGLSEKDKARQMILNFNSCGISKLVTGDKTWMHTHTHIQKGWSQPMETKKSRAVMYCIKNYQYEEYVVSRNSSWAVLQVPCPPGHSVTGLFCKNSVLKIVKRFNNKKHPIKDLPGVHLIHVIRPPLMGRHYGLLCIWKLECCESSTLRMGSMSMQLMDMGHVDLQ